MAVVEKLCQPGGSYIPVLTVVVIFIFRVYDSSSVLILPLKRPLFQLGPMTTKSALKMKLTPSKMTNIVILKLKKFIFPHSLLLGCTYEDCTVGNTKRDVLNQVCTAYCHGGFDIVLHGKCPHHAAPRK